MSEKSDSKDEQINNQNVITFKLDNEMFAVGVSHVREVLDLPNLTRIPTSPHYMRGVVNVRGVAIPVVDLRLKFGMPSVEDTVQTRVLVMEIDLDGELTVVGGLADSVHHVVELNPETIGPPPKIASSWRTDLIQGMGKIDDQFVMILDPDRVFAGESKMETSELALTNPEDVHSKELVNA